MPPARLISPATRERVEREAGMLSSAALRRMEESHDWYRDLPAENRSWVGLVAQSGIAAFVRWFRSPDDAPAVSADVFGTAPRELARSISLKQTLDLMRTIIAVVEEYVVSLAAPPERPAVLEAVLRYSREMAFEAAKVYANAAEVRGVWDARLESMLVSAVLRGEADETLPSRAAALGWDTTVQVCVVVGAMPEVGPQGAVTAVHRAVRGTSLDVLAGVHGRRLVVLVGGSGAPVAQAEQVESVFGPGSVVVGPRVPHLFASGRSARAALAGLDAAPAWPEAPRVLHADDLLPERAVLGDSTARRALVDRVYRPTRDASLLETLTTYLELGSLEATARALFVHPNTVRYRLGRAAEMTGYDVTTPREAWAVRVALTVGRLDEVRPWRPREPSDRRVL